MSRGGIHINGSNRDLTINTNEIGAGGGANAPTLLIPFSINLGNGFRNGRNVYSRVDLMSIKADLKLTTGEIRCGEMYKLSGRHITDQSSYSDVLSFSLTNEVVSKIEKWRNGKLSFWLDINIQLGYYKDISLENGPGLVVMTNTETSFGQLGFEIEQSHWINSILPKLGHTSYKLIEVPLASQLLPVEYSASLVELEEARKYFDLGDYDKAVAHCRSAIDPFKQIKANGLREFVESKSEVDWVNSVIDSTGDWLDKILKATSGFTSKTHHIPSTGHFGRADAEILMMMTIAIIAYVGKVAGKK